VFSSLSFFPLILFFFLGLTMHEQPSFLPEPSYRSGDTPQAKRRPYPSLRHLPFTPPTMMERQCFCHHGRLHGTTNDHGISRVDGGDQFCTPLPLWIQQLPTSKHRHGDVHPRPPTLSCFPFPQYNLFYTYDPYMNLWPTLLTSGQTDFAKNSW